jgi:hypothetical protein
LDFLQERGDLPSQLNNSRWLLFLAFLADVNEMSWIQNSNTKNPSWKWSAPLILSWENWSYGILSWWKVCLTNFQWVHSSRIDSTFNARVYIICTDRILKDSEKKIWRSSFMRKETASELEPPTIYLQTDLQIPLQKRAWYRFLEFNAACTVTYFTSVVKREYIFRFYLLMRLRLFNSEDTTVKVQIINLLVTRCINKFNIQQLYVLPTLYLCVV